MPEQTIPVIDLSDWTGGDPDARARFAQALGEALSDLGFFAVVNHGVDHVLVARAYAASETFFTLPEDDKRAYEDEALKGQRGFTSMGRERAKDHPVPDLKEFWHVGQERPADHEVSKRYGTNLWPDEVRDFKPVMTALYGQLERCAMHLLEACAVYIGEAEGTFRDAAVDGDTILRLIHYPPIPDDAPAAAVRAAAHEDINLITLLCESTDEGLELLQRDGQWRAIHALEGQIVVDSGDMLQAWTNGVFKSTTHRVVNPDEDHRRRLSMPFFVHPRPDVDITPLPSCVARTGGEVSFPSQTANQFLEERLREIGLGHDGGPAAPDDEA